MTIFKLGHYNPFDYQIIILQKTLKFYNFKVVNYHINTMLQSSKVQGSI